MPTDLEQLARLALAAVLGGLVGAERELADQLVTGIGFLGGGAILRHGFTIRGLTTAASIWSTCALGVAVGVGRYLLSAGAVVLVLTALYGLRTFRNLLRSRAPSREELTLVTGPGFAVERVVELLHGEGVSLRGLEREVGTDGGRVLLVTRMPPRYQTEHLIEELAKLDGVREVEWEG